LRGQYLKRKPCTFHRPHPATSKSFSIGLDIGAPDQLTVTYTHR
jgi:hypothetical protein